MALRQGRLEAIARRLRNRRFSYSYRFHDRAREDEIARTEAELGARLPQSFRWFLAEFGGVELFAGATLGVTSSEWGDILQVTLQQRRLFPPLPRRLVIFGVQSRPPGLGLVRNSTLETYCCFDTARGMDGEYPVVLWEAGCLWGRRRRKTELLFLDWLEQKLDETETGPIMPPHDESDTEGREFYWQRVLDDLSRRDTLPYSDTAEARRLLDLLATFDERPPQRLLLTDMSLSLIPHVLAHCGYDVMALIVSPTVARYIATLTVEPDLFPLFAEYQVSPPNFFGRVRVVLDAERTRERIAREQRPGGRATIVNAQLLDYMPTERFDLVYLPELLQRLSGPQQVALAQQLFDWLGPGGVCVVQTHGVLREGMPAVLAHERPFRDAGFRVDHDSRRWSHGGSWSLQGHALVKEARQVSARLDEGTPPPDPGSRIAVFWHDEY